MQWDKARRFRRVCPLLVETPDGWRCSVDTPNVRPFWGRFFRYYGGTLAAIYLTGALGVFIFLRIVGYPVSIVHVTWPPSWHRIGQARGWYFTEKARKAFVANHAGEAILYLSNAYEFDPGNYTAGLMLAKTLQSGQPIPSNQIYERLYHEHVAQREDTAQEWFRGLLARGDFTSIQELARERLLDHTPHASVWMRALVFATRQSANPKPLATLADSHDPGAVVWRPLIEAELLFRSGHPREGVARMNRPDWQTVPTYGTYYQITQLIAAGDVFAAIDRIGGSAAQLDGETRAALALTAFAKQGARRPYQQEVDLLLSPKLSLPVIKILAVQLIRQPDQATLDQLFQKLARDPIAFNTDSAGIYFSLLCAAGVQGDWAKFSALENHQRRFRDEPGVRARRGIVFPRTQHLRPHHVDPPRAAAAD
ncbi:MAG: hypothetical protein JWM35_497 [Verrucomicrobia bacterium]|nr:hypothetical protein [Verrucomicrobiota bacterium]